MTAEMIDLGSFAAGVIVGLILAALILVSVALEGRDGRR